MRFVDVWAGRPLCALLTLSRAIRRAVGLEPDPAGPPRKILIIKLIEQGATVLAYDAIRRAHELVGRENVYFCVLRENGDILDLLDIIPPENVLAIRSGSLFQFASDVFGMLRRVKRLGIDSTVDMEFFARAPAALAYLAGARRRVGTHRFTAELPYRGDLMTHRVPYNAYMHTAAAYRMLVEALTLDPRETPLLKTPPVGASEPLPRFVASQADIDGVRALLRGAAKREITGPVVVLNPNASDMIPLRKWPTERFIELGRRLAEARPDLTIVITGGPAEEAAGEWIAGEIGRDRAASLAGATTMRELVVLYTLADVMVTNDSGPAHFASLTDMDAVVLFGPETPLLYGPLGAHAHVMWAGLACSPCVSAFNHRLSPCTDSRCMQAITVDQVYCKVMELLERRRDG